MSKKTVKCPTWFEGGNATTPASVEGGCSNAGGIQSECPSLGVALTGIGNKKEGGFPPVTIKLFADDGIMKMAIQDAYNKRSAFVTLGSQGSLGECLQRILEAGNFDWRAWGKNKDWA